MIAIGSRFFDYPRIRRHVERQGGKVIAILRRATGLFHWGYSRYYHVRYETRHGSTVTATCGTNVWGVYWVHHAPRRTLPEQDNVWVIASREKKIRVVPFSMVDLAGIPGFSGNA